MPVSLGLQFDYYEILAPLGTLTTPSSSGSNRTEAAPALATTAITPRTLFDRAVGNNVGYAVTGDGQKFLSVTSAEDADLTPFTVVTNWLAEVKK